MVVGFTLWDRESTPIASGARLMKQGAFQTIPKAIGRARIFFSLYVMNASVTLQIFNRTLKRRVVYVASVVCRQEERP